MKNLALCDPDTQDTEEIVMSSLHAELIAMGMALNYIKSEPLLMHTRIVICYDSQVAKGLITGDNKSHNSSSTNLVTAGRRALKETNKLRTTAAKSRLPVGYSPQSTWEANHIQFRWIRAHSGQDVGNAWVDARAKAGAYGHTPDNPIIGQENAPALLEIDQSFLQLHSTEHPQESHILTNPTEIDQYYSPLGPATIMDDLETDDPDIAIFNYVDDTYRPSEPPQDL
jgi:ribonuclease HI